MILMETLRTLATMIRKRRRDILLIFGWTIAIALIIIVDHQQFYRTNPILEPKGIGFSNYLAPVPNELELLLVLLIGAAVSIVLVSVGSIVFGYFASMLLSSLITVVYMFLYNWYTLGLGNLFSGIAFGWEWVMFMAILNVFRYVFPLVVTFSLVGVGIGGVIRTLANL
jgi:hypothetical protein